MAAREAISAEKEEFPIQLSDILHDLQAFRHLIRKHHIILVLNGI